MSKPANYQPPYTITPVILNRVAAISEAIGRLTVLTDQAKALRLRRINRIRTIHGSLAIEGNTLSEAQITAILEGKRVIAPPREVQEVKNALAAYDRFDTWKPEAEKDLLEAHRILMSGLIDEAGMYRRGGVGVMAGQQVIHMAPPADRVPHLMDDLFGWLAATDAHPLIASSVFHYELEFIHPFADGNGRMGRLVAEPDSGPLESPVCRHPGGKPDLRTPGRVLPGPAGEHPARPIPPPSSPSCCG